MASAGIMGMGSDMKISGYEIDAKFIIIFAIVFTVAIKITTAVIKFTQ